MAISLRNLCALCVSAVKRNEKHINRRDAEDAETTQRNNAALDKDVCWRVDCKPEMDLFSNKAVRLLLGFSVSIWMAGGCLFGCANVAAQTSENVIDSGMSCHTKRPHANGPSFSPSANGMMNECPLVVNSTAVTSKNSTHVPDPGRVPVAALPSFEKQIAHTDNTLVATFLPDRGPTHLRCCVFLI